MNMYRSIKDKRGFTIVELLIVIVVIGILAAIVIVAYNGVQNRAKVQKANTDLTTLSKAVQIGRLNTNKTLFGITGNSCTGCSGQAVYEATLDSISAASKVNLNALKKGNPWGGIYIIDENEGETAGTCVADTISPGPNTPAGTVSSITVPTAFCAVAP